MKAYEEIGRLRGSLGPLLWLRAYYRLDCHLWVPLYVRLNWRLSRRLEEVL